MNKKEKILLDNSRTFVLKFSDMKKSKNEILRSKFGDNKSFIKVLDIIVKDFYDSIFSENDKMEISYTTFYFIFQSFFFSDPDNFFLYDEDLVQTLLVNSFRNFKKKISNYYSTEGLAGKINPININTYCVRNFTKSMTEEFSNIKRVMETEIKKPCSPYSSNSSPYSETFKEDSYEIFDEYDFTNITRVKTLYE
jgi:hypothetical protein